MNSHLRAVKTHTHLKWNLWSHWGRKRQQCLSNCACVCVKSKKGSKVIETYAFMDNGNQATFCTEKLIWELGIEGKKTQILLRTMGQEKLEASFHLSGLEVCGLKENIYILLPEIYTRRDIPVSKENIPAQDDLKWWPHFLGIQLPQIMQTLHC